VEVDVDRNERRFGKVMRTPWLRNRMNNIPILTGVVPRMQKVPWIGFELSTTVYFLWWF
jgi:hypothetical protein